MKIKICIVVSLLLLTACGIGKVEYKHRDFTLDYPKDWRVAHISTLDESVKPDFTSFLFYVNEDGNTEATFNVVTVLFDSVPDLESFIVSNVQEAQQIEGYKNEKKSNATIVDQKTKIYMFTALDDGVEKNFMQSYLVKDTKGYVMTAMYPVDAESSLEVDIKNMMKSFTFIEKTNAE